jgi:hypothetical protein
MDQQPYRPPRSSLSGRPAMAGAPAMVTPRMIASLDRTRPWVVFLSVLMIVGCLGLVFLAGAMLIVGGMTGVGGGLGDFGGRLLAAVYFVIALLYVFPALYLWRYGGAIKRIGRGNQRAMEEALESQASFWRFVGICGAVVTAIYGAIFVIAIVMGVMGGIGT